MQVVACHKTHKDLGTLICRLRSCLGAIAYQLWRAALQVCIKVVVASDRPSRITHQGASLAYLASTVLREAVWRGRGGHLYNQSVVCRVARQPLGLAGG